jgi:molybdate transport system substrate-binding protein
MATTTRFMQKKLHVLCAGAAQGLVRVVQVRFKAETGAEVDGLFGAVGAMKEALMNGAPCDVLIVTDAMLRALQGNGAVDGDTSMPIGRVRTGVAVREGDAMPDIVSAAALAATFRAAPAIYLPDTEKSTAGAHLLSVLGRLGLRDAVAAKLAVFANGATAMTALANAGPAGSIGCTQITEIISTPFLALAGALPDPFGLATVYSAGVSANSTDPALAARFIVTLCGAETAALRREAGFEPLQP